MNELVWVAGNNGIPASKMVEYLMQVLLEHAHKNAIERTR